MPNSNTSYPSTRNVRRSRQCANMLAWSLKQPLGSSPEEDLTELALSPRMSSLSFDYSEITNFLRSRLHANYPFLNLIVNPPCPPLLIPWSLSWHIDSTTKSVGSVQVCCVVLCRRLDQYRTLHLGQVPISSLYLSWGSLSPPFVWPARGKLSTWHDRRFPSIEHNAGKKCFNTGKNGRAVRKWSRRAKWAATRRRDGQLGW